MTTEARLFTNVRSAWVERRADGGPARIGCGIVEIGIDALWVEENRVIGA